MNWIGGPFLHWLTSSCIGKIVYIRSSNALVNRILQNVFAKDKISFVKIKNDDDCNFLNCKIKGSNLRFICSWRVLSTPSSPYQALNPKMDNHKRRKLQLITWLGYSFLHLAPSPSVLSKITPPGFSSGWWKPWTGATSSRVVAMEMMSDPGRLHIVVEPADRSSFLFPTPPVKKQSQKCSLVKLDRPVFDKNQKPLEYTSSWTSMNISNMGLM